MRTSFLIAGLCAMTMCAGPALAQSAASPGEFAQKASVSNTFEVEEAKLALQHAASPKVKAFARKMISDHTMAEKKLQAAAKGSGADVTMTLDEPHQAMVTALQGKTGADFDKAYVADQIKAHQDTAALLDEYKTSGSDPKLKMWAAKTLPTVNAHLKMVAGMSGVASL